MENIPLFEVDVVLRVSVLSVAFCLFRFPIPTLKDGITIGGTIEVIVVALVGDTDVDGIIGFMVGVWAGISNVALGIFKPSVGDDWIGKVSFVEPESFVSKHCWSSPN